MSDIHEGEFKGFPILILPEGPEDRYPMQFGLKKAKLILEHYEGIKDFIAEHTTSIQPKPNLEDD